MGHIRLGYLPKTQAWGALFAQLDAPAVDAAGVAAATANAARARLFGLSDDPTLGYCFWLLARLAAASRRPDFVEAVADLGIAASKDDPVVGFIARVSDRVRDEVDRNPESGPFGDIAALALRRALTETVGTEGRSLFGSSLEDLERAVRRHATPARFGELAHRFFGDLLSRSLRFYVDKALPQRIGAGGGLATLAQGEQFIADLDRHARESARIVEEFAGDWYSLHDWQAGGAIGRDEAQGFVAHAMEKLRDELAEAAP